MQAVKVLPKGQITLPKEIRKRLDVQEGDTLVIEKRDNEITLKKGRNIYDYIGFLPKPSVSIDEIIEKATEEAVRERAKSAR